MILSQNVRSRIDRIKHIKNQMSLNSRATSYGLISTNSNTKKNQSLMAETMLPRIMIKNHKGTRNFRTNKNNDERKL